MTITVKINGRKRLSKRLGRVTADVGGPLRSAIAQSVALVQGEAKKSITRGSRSGVTVTRGGKAHTRSAPGEAPKTDTGRLANSIFAEVEAQGRDRIEGRAGTDLEYGKWLEHGTLKMSERPWLQPAFGKSLDRIRKLIRAATSAGVRKGRK